VSVFALGQASDPVRFSRYCHAFVDVGTGEGVQQGYLEWLERAPAGAVILPCADDGLELVARHRTRLEELGHRPIEADDDVLLAMLDKDRTYALADQAGIDRPRTATVRGPEEAEAVELELPYALKPLHSHLFARHFREKLLMVHDRAELRETLQRTRALGLDMLITEVVPGGDDQYHSYYSYLDSDGEPLFHFTKRKFRQFPVRFGLSCYQMSDWHPEAAELGLRFFQKIGLRGVGNVEFKRDARDGRLKLIECNHRFTAANELVRLAGIDLPLLAYRRLTGRGSPERLTYRVGVRMWHPIEDARALRSLRREGELTAREWARSLMHRQHFPMLRLGDPLPTMASLAGKAQRLRGRAVPARVAVRRGGDRVRPV
jgi:predicted ATP-grasp superfamily ATP-dependent carboligase